MLIILKCRLTSSYPSAYLIWPLSFHTSISNSPSLKINSFPSLQNCILLVTFSITWLMATAGIHSINLTVILQPQYLILYLYSDFLHSHCLLSISAASYKEAPQRFPPVCYNSLAGSSFCFSSHPTLPWQKEVTLYFKLINCSIAPLAQGDLNFPNDKTQKAEDRKCVLRIMWGLKV